MRFTLRIAVLAVAVISAVGASCPNAEWVPFQDKCYWRSTYEVEWAAADQICGSISPGALQVSVHDLVHDAFVAETLLDGDRAWLGLRRTDGAWSWSDASPVNWHYWYCTEPSGSSDACTITNYAGTGKWAMYRCDDPHYFVCQVDAIADPVEADSD